MKKLSYVSHIDSLRAISVVLVILFHLDVRFFQGGFIGVDVFFVVSGFLITRILTHEFTQTGSIDFRSFYARRMRRIMPTLFLTIFLTFILAFLAFSPSDFMNATKSMWMSSIALSNFYFLRESGYFDISSNFRPLLHTWSLGIEEQFYLFYPITLFILLRLFSRRKTGVPLSLCFLLLSSFLYTIYTSEYGVSRTFYKLFLSDDNMTTGASSVQFYLLPFRMFEFLIGAVIVFINPAKIASSYASLTANVLGLLVIIGSAVLFSNNTRYMSVFNVVPCLGAGLLLVLPPSKYLSFIFENKYLIYIGKISYTLYLMHWVVIVFYRYLFDGPFSPTEQMGMFVLMLLLSSVIYEFYETPLRSTKAKFSIRSNWALTFILITSILSVYAINRKVVSGNGWVWRLSEKNLELIKEIGVPDDYHINNWGGAGYSSGWVGRQPPEGSQPDLILLGDSHAGHYLYGLDSILVKINNKHIYYPDGASWLKLPDIVRSGHDAECKKNFQDNLKLLNKYPNSTVVLSESWDYQMNRSLCYRESTGTYQKMESDTAGWKLLAQKVEKFHAMSGSKRLFIVIGETPMMNSNELNYVEKLLRPKYLANMAPATSTFPDNAHAFNKFFKNYFRSKDIVFIDPAEIFCDDGTCVKQRNSEIYFSDPGHLSKVGSLKAIRELAHEFLKRGPKETVF